MDLDRRYDELLAHPQVKKRALSARAMLTRIAQTQFESGYPYIVYKSNANRAHPLKALGQIKMSNLCTEIFQLQTPTLVGEAGEVIQPGFDISCNLGSLNIVNVMEQKNLAESVHTAMDALTAVSDASAVRQVPGVYRANQAFHSVGLGAMNLHGFLAKNRLSYESVEARDFVQSFFAAVNYHSLKRSMEIAREREVRFLGFEQSTYADGSYFENYLQDFRPRTEAVQKLFQGIPLPSPEDWARLKEEVAEHGLYHAYRLAIAPTASISYIQNATPSIQPIVEHVETRTYGNATTYYPMPFLSEETYWFYKSAYHMNMYRLIDLVAEAQAHVDQGISTVIYVTSETSTRELARLYVYAAKKGLKSLYYTRTKNLSVEECLSCSV
jgi:ribonucleoside-diphosphate reductase alpha chain